MIRTTKTPPYYAQIEGTKGITSYWAQLTLDGLGLWNATEFYNTMGEVQVNTVTTEPQLVSAGLFTLNKTFITFGYVDASAQGVHIALLNTTNVNFQHTATGWTTGDKIFVEITVFND